MAGVSDLVSYAGNFKKRYADKIQKYMPDHAKVYKQLTLKESQKIGDEYQEPIILTRENGVTYAGQGKLVTLAAPNSAEIKFAKLRSYEVTARSAVPYSTLTRSENSAAFDSTMQLVMTNLMDSMYFRLEADYLHGQSDNGWGVISAVAGNVITITAATFAPGFWNGSEGLEIDIFNGVNKVVTASIVSVDPDARTVTVSAAGGAAATHVIYPKGAKNDGTGTYENCLGIRQILASTGTVFDLATASYSMWRPTTHSIGGVALTFAGVNNGMAKTAGKGFSGNWRFYTNPKGYADLIKEIEAARHFTLEYAGNPGPKRSNNTRSEIPGRVERGGGGDDFLMYYSPMGNSCQIIPHPMMMEGEAFALDAGGSWFKVGSTEPTFKLPNAEAWAEMFLNLPNQNGVEVRCMSDVSPFTNYRCASIYFNNIVNS